MSAGASQEGVCQWETPESCHIAETVTSLYGGAVSPVDTEEPCLLLLWQFFFGPGPLRESLHEEKTELPEHQETVEWGREGTHLGLVTRGSFRSVCTWLDTGSTLFL